MLHSVGYRSLSVRDAARDISFPVITFYPTSTASQSIAFGPYTIDVATDAPVQNGLFPLLVLSHGSGSSPLVNRTLALHLARQGYVVALPEHYGDNRNNQSWEGTLENLMHRPRHITLAIDTVLETFKDYMQTDKVAVIGHSMGGYSALALAGGQPWWSPVQKIEVPTDPRLRAIVLMAPATTWFIPNDALKKVRVPILMLSAEHDQVTKRWQAQLLLDNIPDRSQVTWQLIRNAGHLSFLSPFPDSMKHENFAPAMDPEGFDRDVFHGQLNDDVQLFLDTHLKGF